MKSSYWFKGIEFPYLPESDAPRSGGERRLELPLLRYALDQMEKSENTMEIGAVSNAYFFPQGGWPHAIYDATELYVYKAFAEDLNYTGKDVISISTIEHIGRNEYGLAYHPYRSITTLNKMLEGRKYLITFSVGYNRLLDRYVEQIVIPREPEHVFTFHRDENNDWNVDPAVNMRYAYGNPYPWGNGVCVIANLFDRTGDGVENGDSHI